MATKKIKVKGSHYWKDGKKHVIKPHTRTLKDDSKTVSKKEYSKIMVKMNILFITETALFFFPGHRISRVRASAFQHLLQAVHPIPFSGLRVRSAAA